MRAAFCGLALVLAGCGKVAFRGGDPAEAEDELPPVPGVVDKSELANGYARDYAAAAAKWTNRRMTVAGHFYSATKTGRGYDLHFALIQGDGSPVHDTSKMVARFPTGAADDLARLKRGDPVRLECKCLGPVERVGPNALAVVLDDCRLASEGGATRGAAAPPGEVDAQELARLYAENQAAAARWAGREVIVTGLFHSARRTAGGYDVLFGYRQRGGRVVADLSGGVIARFAPDAAALLSGLREGDALRIAGRPGDAAGVPGGARRPALSDCRLLSDGVDLQRPEPPASISAGELEEVCLANDAAVDEWKGRRLTVSGTFHSATAAGGGSELRFGKPSGLDAGRVDVIGAVARFSPEAARALAGMKGGDPVRVSGRFAGITRRPGGRPSVTLDECQMVPEKE